MKEQKRTLCWDCKHAVPCPRTGTGCPWSQGFTPVEGWEATACHWEENGQPVESYCVTHCPLYAPGRGAPQTKNAPKPHAATQAGRTRKRWSAREVAQLQKMLQKGLSYSAIAARLGRDKNSVWQRAHRLKGEE